MEYDTSKVGLKIAKGGDATVYHYGSHQVIKFSSLSKVFGSSISNKLKRDYKICLKYFPIHTVKVSFVKGKIYKHIEIQDYMDGEELRLKHMKNKEIVSQFKEILCIIDNMKESGHAPPDLIGNKGMIHRCFSNIFVKNNQLHLVDATLLESASAGFWGYVFSPFMEIAKLRQKSLIKRFLSYCRE